jgi:hypothetical protein
VRLRLDAGRNRAPQRRHALRLGALSAARAAAEAARALQALDDELREATRMELGDDYYAEWHADGLRVGGVGVVLAARIAARAVDVAGGAERAGRIAADAERIAEGAEDFALAVVDA